VIGLALNQLFLFDLAYLVELLYIIVSELLEPIGAPALIVFGDLFVFLEVTGLVQGVPPRISNADPALFHPFIDHLDQLLPPLISEGWDGDADQSAVVAGIQAQVGLKNGLLNNGNGLPVPGLDREEPGLWHRYAGKLVQGHHGPIVINQEVFHQGRIRPARTNGSQVLTEGIEGPLHLGLGF